MKVKILGAHNCETREYRHTCLVVDDVLALDAGSLTASLSMDEQKALQAVLLTHQHYDHIRDVIALGTNVFHSGLRTDIFTTSCVSEILETHFFSSGIYRNLAAVPEQNPTLGMNIIEPGVSFSVAGYDIEAVPVKHSAYTVGYKVSGEDGGQIFYTSDTGPGLSGCWERVSPKLLIIEVTESNRSTETMRNVGHLTPALLEEELVSFQKIRGYVPDIVTVHMSPDREYEIVKELIDVSHRMRCSIIPGFEGMEIAL